jgi:hypothetical protein
MLRWLKCCIDKSYQRTGLPAKPDADEMQIIGIVRIVTASMQWAGATISQFCGGCLELDKASIQLL